MSLWQTVTMVVSLFAAAFFAGSETAFVYTDSRGISKMGGWWKNRMQRLLATTLVGTNISIILLSITAARAMHGYFGTGGAFYSVLIVSVTSLFFCEVVPKSLGLRFNTEFANASAFPLWLFYTIFWPLIWVAETLARPLSRFFGLYFQSEKGITEEDILHFVSHEGTELDDDKKKALAQILLLESTPIYELMSPVAQLPRIEHDATRDEAINAMKKGRRNIAIVIGEDDMEMGFLQRTDLEMSRTLQSVIRTEPVVPMTKTAGEVISDLSHDRESTALIVGEQGEIAGIVTMHSLFAEITGERPRGVFEATRKEITLSAQINIRHLSQVLGIELPRSRHYQTLGGLITELTGRIPQTGEEFEVSGFLFRILSATRTQVKLVSINRMQDKATKG